MQFANSVTCFFPPPPPNPPKKNGGSNSSHRRGSCISYALSRDEAVILVRRSSNKNGPLLRPPRSRVKLKKNLHLLWHGPWWLMGKEKPKIYTIKICKAHKEGEKNKESYGMRRRRRGGMHILIRSWGYFSSIDGLMRKLGNDVSSLISFRRKKNLLEKLKEF